MKDQIELQGGRTTIKKLRELKLLCLDSSAWKTSAFHAEVIRSQSRELRLVLAEITAMEELLDDYIAETFPEEMQLLTSIPGVGKITAMQAMTVIGDPRRFDVKKDGNGAK